MSTDAMTIGHRFNGPRDSGHGGYVCGRLAALWTARHGGSAAVTLLAPPPLATPMKVRDGSRRMSLWHGSQLIATVTANPRQPPVVPPVSLTQAAAAQDCYLGSVEHPFPTCFACGPSRSLDGLRLRPGPVAGRPGAVACVWTPDDGFGSPTPSELVWSVLDCPSGWVTDPRSQPAVLTRMAAQLVRPVRPGQQYVVVASSHERRGRTATNHSAIYDSAGVLAGCAAVIWTVLSTDRPVTEPAAIEDVPLLQGRNNTVGTRP
jgi:hypothetical protein